MSFYAKDSVLTFKWIINPTASPLVKTDYDVTLTLPDGVSTYTNDGVTTYVAPTATVQGEVTYDLTPALTGRYQVTLSDGTDTAHIVQAKRDIYVVVPPAHVLTGSGATTTQGPGITPPPAPSWSPTGDSYALTPQGENQGQTVTYMDAGARVAFAGISQDRMYVLDLSPDLDLSSATYNSDNLDLSVYESNIRHTAWKPDGLTFWTSTQNSGGFQWIKEWSVAASPWVIAGASYVILKNGPAPNNRGFRWKNDDGTVIYVLDPNSDTIYQYSVAAGWDITSVFTQTATIVTNGATPVDFAFNSNGSQLWVLYGDGTVDVYTLSTLWDIGSASGPSPNYTLDFSATCPAPLGFDIYGSSSVVTNIIMLETTGTDTLYSFVLE